MLITRHLSERASVHSTRHHDRGQTVTMGVPRSFCIRQAQCFGERLAHCDSTIAESRQRTSSTPELQNQSFLEGGVKTEPTAAERAQPAGGFQSEGDRRPRLQQGSSEHHRLSMLLLQTDQGGIEACMIRFQDRSRLLKQEDQGGVGDVLAGSPPMHEPRGGGIDGAHTLR
jgi:hypothetical protein